jgi:hypothetical protein
MVQAILSGTKTQTRRVMKPQPVEFSDPRLPVTHGWKGALYGGWEVSWNKSNMTATDALGEFCPYGQAGDHLWVREAHVITAGGAVLYATDPRGLLNPRSPIFMPRWASRITLEITSVRVERVQDITEADAKAEGCTGEHFDTAVSDYIWHWQRINGKRTGCAWQDNPWVWAVEFRAVKA